MIIDGSFTVDLGGLSGKITFPVHRDAPNDSPPFSPNVDRGNPIGLSWIDAPDLFRRYTGGYPVTDADITFTFVFRAMSSRTMCFGYLQLHLVVRNGEPIWNP